MSKKNIFSLFIAVNFLLISCSSSSSSKKKSVAAQRAVETREYAVDTKSLMTSSIGAFQDLGFTIDTLNEEFGLITASKVEEEEEEDDEGLSAGKVLGALLIIGVLIALDDILPDGDDSGGGGSTTTVIKDYKLTATLTIKPISETEPVLSSLRINFGGSERKRSIRFFKEFFTAIDKSLFLDENLDAAKDVAPAIN